MNALLEDLDKQGLMVLSKKQHERMVRCLEYIEMKGCELGHFGKNCYCGACMAEEARKALEEK